MATGKRPTERQKEIAAMRAKGMINAEVADRLGVSEAAIRDSLKSKGTSVSLMNEFLKNTRAAAVTRQDVVEGIQEAIEMGRMLADPQAMIAGWREMAKICGFYAPETKRIELTIGAANVKNKFEMLSDEDLFKIAHGRIIEGEATEVQSGE
jgi:predicted transcriptional regulator